MTELEFVKLMTKLSQLMPSFTLTQEQAKAWYPFFKNYDVKTFNIAITYYVMSSRYAPTIKDLLDSIHEVCQKNGSATKLLSGEDAWKLVRASISKFSMTNDLTGWREYLKSQDELTAQVAESFVSELTGVYSDKLPFIKKDFIKSYDRLASGLVRSFELEVMKGAIAISHSNVKAICS